MMLLALLVVLTVLLLVAHNRNWPDSGVCLVSGLYVLDIVAIAIVMYFDGKEQDG
jgi:hypothetical protein